MITIAIILALPQSWRLVADPRPLQTSHYQAHGDVNKGEKDPEESSDDEGGGRKRGGGGGSDSGSEAESGDAGSGRSDRDLEPWERVYGRNKKFWQRLAEIAALNAGEGAL